MPFEFETQNLKNSDYNSTFFYFKINPNIENFSLGEKELSLKLIALFAKNQQIYRTLQYVFKQ
jgi:hypothetical protein